ncbi:MAG: hypothetical protein L0332_03335 [Chloroflexi bacterium]|nr:hypothetical protein [Chloroflexota bacterium]MCI0579671.1 hypothetical protein [Chloroflexota bacterium]MCI0645889.1 hypothetical protein [Chloroflexota bacterium]MCI0725744.1 hypothetical protein [Chloroflexota bacterium]
MEVINILDLHEDLAAGQRAAKLYRELEQLTLEELRKHSDQVFSQQELYFTALSGEYSEQLVALRQLIASSDALLNVHDLVSTVNSLRSRVNAHEPSIVNALKRIADLARVELAEQLILPELREVFTKARNSRLDAEELARSMLSLPIQELGTMPKTMLEGTSQTRLWGLHTLLLTELVVAEPRADLLDYGQLKAIQAESARRMRTFRDRVRQGAGMLNDNIATPDDIMTLWGALFDLESWLLETGFADVARASAAATYQVQNGASDAERWARTAGQAYEAIRTALALDAGTRQVLIAYALHDEDTLSNFAASSHLRLGPATLDLKRSSLAQVSQVEEGTLVEIDAVVQDADYVAGGPRPRTLLILGKPTATQVTARLPFTSADSFGIIPGIWVQVRGTAYPNGKGSVKGPLVEVRRIRRGAVANESFTDWLIWAGRDMFEYRPGELDIIGGRLAGTRETLNESSARLLLQ